jgi:hypothetical protein
MQTKECEFVLSSATILDFKITEKPTKTKRKIFGMKWEKVRGG